MAHPWPRQLDPHQTKPPSRSSDARGCAVTSGEDGGKITFIPFTRTYLHQGAAHDTDHLSQERGSFDVDPNAVPTSLNTNVINLFDWRGGSTVLGAKTSEVMNAN